MLGVQIVTELLHKSEADFGEASTHSGSARVGYERVAVNHFGEIPS